jgi:3-deoxy-manno-octulosonate cytidylyltransferase (CMP-KDO synthetase)
VTAVPGAVAIVPVRVGSQRLPRKALLAESGRALFLHTWERTVAAGCFEACYVATDDAEVTAAAREAGAPVLATDARPRTGSERCAQAAAALPARFVVDVQGDWPEVDPGDLRRLTEALAAERAACVTLGARLADPARAADPNVVKIALGQDGFALYFSRAAIPYARDPQRAPPRWRHIGVYGFTRAALLAVPGLPNSGLEEQEALEQLRFLENGMRILVLEARGEPWGIESRADYDAFLQRMRAGGRERSGGRQQR